jgi:hypothetical protein
MPQQNQVVVLAVLAVQMVHTQVVLKEIPMEVCMVVDQALKVEVLPLTQGLMVQ